MMLESIMKQYKAYYGDDIDKALAKYARFSITGDEVNEDILHVMQLLIRCLLQGNDWLLHKLKDSVPDNEEGDENV